MPWGYSDEFQESIFLERCQMKLEQRLNNRLRKCLSGGRIEVSAGHNPPNSKTEEK